MIKMMFAGALAPASRYLITTFGLILTLFSHAQAEVLYQQAFEPSQSKPKLIIIIDDIGDNLPLGQRAIDLPGKITAAFIPFTPNAKRLAQRAHSQGKELMLHMPMSNLRGANIGKGGLTPDLSPEQFRQRLNRAINFVPHISGINNHMGSELTAMAKPMQQLMNELGCHKLYFVDSRTNGRSVAYKTAQAEQLDSLVRDVFLDHDPSPAAISQAFEKLKRVAKRHGSAIAIGHPYPSTLDFLEQALPQLEQQGYELIFPSELLNLAPPTTKSQLALR